MAKTFNFSPHPKAEAPQKQMREKGQGGAKVKFGGKQAAPFCGKKGK